MWNSLSPKLPRREARGGATAPPSTVRQITVGWHSVSGRAPDYTLQNSVPRELTARIIGDKTK